MTHFTTQFCAKCSRHMSNCRCDDPLWEVHSRAMSEPDFAQLLRQRREGKPSYDPKVDLNTMTVRIPVVEFICGDGKVFYSSNCDPDIARKLAVQYTRRNMGVRSMQILMMERDKFNGLKEEMVSVLLIEGN